MKWIGLTGGIASGKSTVARWLRQRGYAVVDADELAHLVVQPGAPALQEIAQTFGQDYIKSDGSLDRLKLGQHVFNKIADLKKLEAITHPRIRELSQKKRQDLAGLGHPVAFYDVPLLFEKNLESDFDKIVVVSCRPEQQVERLVQRNHFGVEDAKHRISVQLPLSEKEKKADFVIKNEGSLADLEVQMQAFVEWLKTI